ncbi:MAG: hypothetical protein U0263_04080 [Polyangiaceae bacterium]
MHSSEWNELTPCADCGAEVAPGPDRAFLVNDEALLCFECATKRGGAWDAVHERWTKAPSLDGIPDPRRPHP